MARPDPADITVVMQGDWRANTAQAIAAVRRWLAGAHLVFSTVDERAAQRAARLADEVLLSPDPGVLPPFAGPLDGRPSNLNRQIVSSAAGLQRVRTPYALKLRSDCELLDGRVTALYERHALAAGWPARIVASGLFTRHPRGMACYPCHVSDWLHFGRSARVQALWSAAPLAPAQARWFEQHTHARGSTALARRWRARYAPEQYITVAFARALGYATPEYLDDLRPAVVQDYRRLLAREFVIAFPQEVGITVPAYAPQLHSTYQRLDCIDLAAWQALAGGPGEGRWGLARAAAHAGRHALAVATLARLGWRRRFPLSTPGGTPAC